MFLVDTSIPLDVATDDPRWSTWSLERLELAAAQGPVAINAIVYAELSIGYARIEDIDAVLAAVGIDIIEIPRAALFLAGKAFAEYRRRRGVRTNVLPDFFIGAHAAVADLRLITRDPRRVRGYFPTVRLIAPA